MRDSTQKDLAVFDFTTEDEAVEPASKRFAKRLQSRLRPKMDDSVKKCHFLEAFAPGWTLKHDVSGVLCIDMNERGNSSGSYIIGAPEQGLDEKEQLDEIMASNTSHDEHGPMCQDEFEDGALNGKDSSDGMEADVISEDEENSSIMMGSQSSPSDTAEDDEGCLQCSDLEDHCAAVGNGHHNKIAVLVFPDYVIHDRTLYGESQLMFTSYCVKIECSDASGGDEKFTSEWAISDLVHVDSRWSGSVSTALVKLCVKSNDGTIREKHYNDSDVLKVMFSIHDMRWLEKEQKIMNLAARYKDIWNANSGDMMWENDFVDNNAFFSRDNFTEFTDSFEDVVYPKGDPDAVSISKRDIDLLQPETFINDTIIDFYIKYLKNKIQPDQKHRFHFFNSFFFRKLADLDKDRGNVSEGRAAFLRVRKWTRKVNIFEKDYILIPVNFNLHWSLLVICHPGEISNSNDDEIDCNKVPCILHMDSIKGSHSGVKNIIQSYIWEEWKERHPEETEDASSKFLNLRFVPLELPQQENSFDCGLFLLHYVEMFLEEAPQNFDPFKITRLSSFLSADWFPPSEASLKRTLIRKLIYELLNDSFHKLNPSTHGDGHPTMSGYPENIIEAEEHVKLLSAHCSPAKDAMGALCPDSEDGVELLTTSSSAHCVKEAELMLPEFLEAASNTVPLPENREHAHHHTAASLELLFASNQTEDCADEREDESSLSLEKEDCRRLEENLDTHFCTTSSLNDADASVAPWATMDEKDANVDPSPACDNDNSMNGNNRVELEATRASPDNAGYVPDTPPASSREKLDDIPEDSQEADTTKVEGSGREDSPMNPAVEDDCQIVDSKETKTNVCEVDDVCEVSRSGNAEDGDDDCLELDSSKVETVACEDHQETSSRTERHDDASHEISRSCMEVNNSNCGNRQENMSPSFEEIIITDDDDKSLDKDDAQVISKRVVQQQPNKRRKTMVPEGNRRRTRSSTRESHSDT